MFLKRIEMHGFKSFADNIVINFDDPITGIVGPNGCGKSNISDAIRWVLGEQSVKSLRGEKMTDIIFAGTEERKPMNMAEVTLVFDNSQHMLNSDLDEIELTLLGQGQRVPAGHDAQLFAVLIHDADLAVANLLVNHEIVDTETPPKSVRAMKKEQRIAPL